MSWKRRALGVANKVLNQANVHVMPHHDFRSMQIAYLGPSSASPPLDPDSLQYLSFDNPRYIELCRLYAGHPAADHSQWSEVQLQESVRLSQFRGDNHYVYQTRWSPSPETFVITGQYVEATDRLSLFGNILEDGMFGAYTVPFSDQYLVSRDLLDSINELNFLARAIGKADLQGIRLLDIGAGYGRLAYRLAENFSASEAVCVDAVPLSTFISEFYLRYRKVDHRASVLPLSLAEEGLRGQSFDIVTNIHSFSECTFESIGWWMNCLKNVDVPRLVIVPNARDQFLSTETNGKHLDFLPLINSYGWKLRHSEEKYGLSKAAQKHALYPRFNFHLFDR